jgi:hypothetical protein
MASRSSKRYWSDMKIAIFVLQDYSIATVQQCHMTDEAYEKLKAAMIAGLSTLVAHYELVVEK